MYVKAAPGMKVRDADLKDLLPDEGRDVPDTDYWQRRLRDKDVVLAEPPVAPAADAALPAPTPRADKVDKSPKPDAASSTS